MIFYDVSYFKNGEIQYRSIEAVGMGGALTFMKPGKFSVSMNARHYQPLPNWMNPFPARWPNPFTVMISRLGNLWGYLVY